MNFDFKHFITSIISLVIGVGILMFFQLVFWPTYRHMESNGQGWIFMLLTCSICFLFIYWYNKKYPEPSYKDDE